MQTMRSSRFYIQYTLLYECHLNNMTQQVAMFEIWTTMFLLEFSERVKIKSICLFQNVYNCELFSLRHKL